MINNGRINREGGELGAWNRDVTDSLLNNIHTTSATLNTEKTNWHSQLLKSANKLGYKLNKSGICLGLGAAGANAFWVSVLTEQDGLKAYLEGLLRLHLDTQAILQKKRSNNYQFRLFAFFDRVKLLQESQDQQTYHCDLLPNSEEQTTSAQLFSQLKDLIRPSSLVSSKGKPISEIDMGLFLGAYTLDELNIYLDCLRDHLGDLPFELQLTNSDHTVFLCMCPTKKQWLLFEFNIKPLIVFNTTVQTNLAKGLKVILSNDSTHTVISTVIRTVDIFADEFKEKMAALNADDRWKQLHKITPAKAAIQDSIGYDLLYIAARENAHTCINELITAGANVNRAIQNGATPLYIVAQHGHLESLQMLIIAAADVNIATSDYRATPLYIAAHRGYLQCLRALIAAGADVNITTSDDNTSPLYIAAQCGHMECVKELIATGADVSKTRTIQLKQTSFKETAEEVARNHGHHEIADLIQRQGLNSRKANRL